jgi:hypothetical protein
MLFSRNQCDFGCSVCFSGCAGCVYSGGMRTYYDDFARHLWAALAFGY